MSTSTSFKTLAAQKLAEKKAGIKAEAATPAKKKPKKALFKKAKASEAEGTLLSVALTAKGINIKLEKDAYDPLIKVYDLEHWSEAAQLDIPEADTDYVVQWDEFAIMAAAIENKDKPLITGPAGTGKTTMVKLYAAITNHPYMRINGKDGMEPSSFLGTPWASEGSMEWKDGSVTSACKLGYLLAFDEPFKVSSGIAMALQWLYEDGGKLLLDDHPNQEDKLVTPHEDFRMALCDNVKGLGDNIDKFGATQVQDSSSLDRFGVSINLKYMDSKAEAQLLANWFSEITPTLAEKIVQLAGNVRAGYGDGSLELSMSPRTIKKFAMYSLQFRDVNKAFEVSYLNKLAEEEEIAAANNLFMNVFGKEV